MAVTARALGIFGAAPAASGAGVPLPTIVIDDMVVRSGIVPANMPPFDARTVTHDNDVLVRVRCFSCNFRDKGFIWRLQSAPGDRFFPIGSEFVGVVEAVGRNVQTLRRGDRVIPDHHFTLLGLDEHGRNAAGVREGIATNSASREYHVFPEGKLLRVPDGMPDDVAAGFGLAAQTAYSMIRKTAPSPGAKVLVTAATSSTSLMLISALSALPVTIYVTTTSTHFDDRLRALGASHIFHVGRDGEPFHDHRELMEVAVEEGGFECAYDPFFDLHMEKAIQVMAPFGRYITCGFVAQNPGAARKADVRPIDTSLMFANAMLKNLTIFGNCLGIREDLAGAMDDYTAHKLTCSIDSVFGGVDTAPFLNRTFNDRNRFGKVVFSYADS